MEKITLIARIIKIQQRTGQSGNPLLLLVTKREYVTYRGKEVQSYRNVMLSFERHRTIDFRMGDLILAEGLLSVSPYLDKNEKPCVGITIIPHVVEILQKAQNNNKKEDNFYKDMKSNWLKVEDEDEDEDSSNDDSKTFSHEFELDI